MAETGKGRKVVKVLLINGSPNENGCTFTALSEVATALEANGIGSEIFHIGRDRIYGCNACRSCKKTGKCVYDDICNEMALAMQKADGIVIGSPVYFSGPNGALCALLDRAFFIGGDYAGKPGAAVVSCRRGGASASFDRLNKYFTIMQMPVVASQYWNSVHGNTPEEVKKDIEGLQIMRTLGNNMAWLLKSIKDGKAPRIVDEPKVATNFIR
jgi:multimeric flavodoxin WrbA